MPDDEVLSVDAQIRERMKKRLRERAPFKPDPEPSPFAIRDPAVDAMSRQVENLSKPESYQTDAEKREYLYRRTEQNPYVQGLQKAPAGGGRRVPLRPAEPDPDNGGTPDQPYRWNKA
jgi:hypothetical protein